jgi:hypothetical protein
MKSKYKKMTQAEICALVDKIPPNKATVKIKKVKDKESGETDYYLDVRRFLIAYAKVIEQEVCARHA